MLTLKPKGRGNWAPVLLRLDGAPGRMSPLLIRVGQTIPLGGVTWRICKVVP